MQVDSNLHPQDRTKPIKPAPCMLPHVSVLQVSKGAIFFPMDSPMDQKHTNPSHNLSKPLMFQSICGRRTIWGWTFQKQTNQVTSLIRLASVRRLSGAHPDIMTKNEVQIGTVTHPLIDTVAHLVHDFKSKVLKNPKGHLETWYFLVI